MDSVTWICTFYRSCTILPDRDCHCVILSKMLKAVILIGGPQKGEDDLLSLNDSTSHRQFLVLVVLGGYIVDVIEKQLIVFIFIT